MSDFAEGAKLLGRGMRMVLRSPRLVVLGMIPALLSLILFTGLFVLLLFFLGDLVGLATWYAQDWTSAFWRGMAEVGTGAAILGVAGLLAVLSFTAVTLLIGDPFYEAIAESIEEQLGGVPDEVPSPWWRSLRRSLVDSARLLLLTMAIAVPLFLFGLIPLVGQTVVPVVGAAIGGWFLAVELVGIAFYRRGLGLADRRRMLRQHRPVALGFGVAVLLCFLVPFGTILVMPAAVAGGTLLARRVLAQASDHSW